MVFTSKKMRDRRFRKIEETILTVFFDEYRKGSTMRRLAKKVGAGRSTMYIHHHAVREVIPDYEKYILAEYRSFMRKKLKMENADLKNLYFDTLVFILRNRKFFEVFLKFDDREILIKMLDVIKDKAVIFMRLPKNHKKIFGVYKGEVVEIIFEWGERGFLEGELEKVLSDILYLSKTARARLIPIS